MNCDNSLRLSNQPELSKWVVADSLHRYVEIVNGNLNLPSSQLYAYPEIDMRYHPARSGIIHPDGDYGLALSYSESTKGVAFLGYDIGSGRRNQLRTEFPLVSWNNIQERDPVILQLQTSGDPEAIGYFNSIRWERLLTDWMVEWSERNGFGKIYLIPAEMNPYDEVRLSDWGKRRYNGTAKKCRFKKGSNGLYVYNRLIDCTL